MDGALTSYEQEAVKTLGVVRGFRPETALKYANLAEPKTVEATRKRLERAVEKGVLAKSNLPAGSQMFRLSNLGVKLANAPKSFSDSPSEGIACEMLSVSACAWKTDQFVFLTREQCAHTLAELMPSDGDVKFSGRFVLRTIESKNQSTGLTNRETQLHFWLAEFKPAEQLARRVEVISRHLVDSNPVFATLIKLGLFGVTIAVPSAGVKATLERKKFPVEASVVVIDELNAVVKGRTRS